MRFLSLLIMVLLTSTSFSQTTLRGNITDAEGNLLLRVHVYFEDSNYGTYSELDGDYVILKVPTGAYKLVISYVGYADQAMNVILEAEKVQYIDI